MGRIREINSERILKASCIEFAEKGYAATKIMDIANKVDLPKPNIYYYFQSKEKLYRCVLESIIDPLLKASNAFEIYDEPGIALEQYIHTKIHISQQHPHASKVFSSEIMHGAPHLTQDVTDKLMQQTTQMTARINQWIADEKMEAVDPQHLLFMIWASTQTYADFDWQIAKVTGKKALDTQDYQTAANLITRMVLKGCGLNFKETT
ncbi:TetR/AcrR family transcriptional regulator [Neptunomonas qingdaonensis]|uniref:Transcriptional regulator, TetR family n=1 Tax=Neptunomonas qingdaonensis TaxID=1045558 RepID=A0A1I2P8D5_9GAMM|nr:TetR/AcrR family transcriptional regulator [Neptunomonas qingdaonensis]SFG12405.1 transcriptional regulator, TetR family [Neptunomonas qingdaonensis]